MTRKICYTSRVHQALLLEAWREVGRHLELPELMERLFTPLQKVLSVSLLIVRRVDVAAAGVETVAVGTGRGSRAPGSGAHGFHSGTGAGASPPGAERVRRREGARRSFPRTSVRCCPTESRRTPPCSVPLPPGIEDEETPPGVLVRRAGRRLVPHHAATRVPPRPRRAFRGRARERHAHPRDASPARSGPCREPRAPEPARPAAAGRRDRGVGRGPSARHEAGRAGGAIRRPRPDLRGDRHRQGGGRPRDPRALAPQPRAR